MVRNLNNLCSDNCIFTYKRINLDLCLLPHIKTSSKWIIDLNIRAKTMKLLEENIGVYFYDLGLGNGFSKISDKIGKMDIHKIQS